MLEPGEGFTCSSFVLGVFDAIKIRIVDVESWPIAANAEWKEHIINIIGKVAEAQGLDVGAHVAALREQTGFVRVTPQEVAAAVCLGLEKYEDVKPAAERVGEYLQNHFPPIGEG